jgi:hypothetical protein
VSGDDLASLQSLVAAAALHPRSIATDVELATRASGAIVPNPRMSSVAQLDVYREQFWARHVHSLEDDFALAAWLLGQTEFFDLVAAYIADAPPRSFDLRGLGAKLPQFASGRAPYANEALLLEALRFDWAFMEAYDAPPGRKLDPAKLASASEDDWPTARIAFDPSVRTISLGHPLHELRGAIRRGERPDRPPPRATRLVVYRGAEQLHVVEIEPMAADLLDALAGGTPLEAACARVAEAHTAGDAEALGPKVGAWFQEWTARAWVSDVTFG